MGHVWSTYWQHMGTYEPHMATYGLHMDPCGPIWATYGPHMARYEPHMGHLWVTYGHIRATYGHVWAPYGHMSKNLHFPYYFLFSGRCSSAGRTPAEDPDNENPSLALSGKMVTKHMNNLFPPSLP